MKPADPLPTGRILQLVPSRALALLVLLATLPFAGWAAEDDGYAEAMAQEHANETGSASPAAQQEAKGPVESADVVYGELADGPITGYLARPDGPQKGQPGIIVIHEWWGLNDNIRSMTRQLAGEGYVALAVDLYGGSQADKPADARALLKAARKDPERMLENLRQAHDYLVKQGAPRTGSLGWCFGGGMALETGLLLGDELDAVVMYYGRPATELEALKAPLLGLFGAKDHAIRVPEVRAFEENLEKLGKTASIHLYPNATHAFANPSGSRYQAQAAKDAWARTLGFFKQHLQP